MKYKNLTEKADVLYNLNLSMNERNATEYARLLDPDQFTFQFWPDNYGHVGLTLPSGWGYDDEKNAAAVLLNKGGGLRNNPVLSISLDLVDFANAQWEEYDPDNHPGWFRTTVQYNFSVTTENETSYITTGEERAEFTVRPREVGGATIWQLVEWVDMVGSPASVAAVPNGTEQATWSILKALYPPPQ